MSETTKKTQAAVSTRPARQPVPRSARDGQGSSGQGSSGHALRCAIYTRKSSEEGLEQDFNSLQAQREACEAYIASQRHEGWHPLTHDYDDGGFSGGSMERPGLKRLLIDVEAGQIDILVVYKVDRLTRSLADFAKIVEILDARGVSFVSVTQSFNTTSSMGRLTLNVLLSFAQFEREVTAERIRDKIAASKRKGMFMGGPVPLGYRVENRKLHIVEDEAATIRTIFRTYLQSRSTILAARELDRLGIRTRQRPLRDGKLAGGVPFTYGSLQALLRNRVYLGDIGHKGEWFPGEHKAILDRETFEAVQHALVKGRASENRSPHRMQSMLTGRIFDSEGNRMAPSHTNKNGLRYRYYISRALLDGRRQAAGKPARVRSDEVEALVAETILKQSEGERRTVSADNPEVDTHAMVVRHLERVEVHDNRIEIVLRSDESRTGESGAMNVTSRLITVPCSLGFTKPHLVVVEAGHEAGPPAENSNGPAQCRNRDRLIVGIHKARLWLDELIAGKVPDILEIANREGKSRRNASMMINLAFVGPDIVEQLLANERTTFTATLLAQSLPDSWEEQTKLLKEANR